MDPLREALAGYAALDETESSDLVRVRELIERGDPWNRDHPLHVTASSLIVEAASRRVLLRWHKRMGRWMQVGGHGDPGERDPWEVASREAREETGLVDLHAFAPLSERRPLQIVIVPVPGNDKEPAHEHADLRYAMETTRPDETVPESPEAPLRWVNVTTAEEQTDDENLRVLLRRVAQMLEG